MTPIYDTIGLTYAQLRHPDRRIAAQIRSALGEAHTVLNVGAGAGSYEPTDCAVTAIDPSARMIAQRPASDATVIRGRAENMPFEDDSFDAVMAILTVHHWQDIAKGMAEMRRVSRGPVVILTFDPAVKDFWLYDYFPELATLDEEQMPLLEAYSDWLGSAHVTPVLIPHDCTDGFLAAYWRRPSAYLDPKVRSAMSSFWKTDDIGPGLERLQNDLDTGRWETRYGALSALEERDFGYRLVVAP